MVMLLFHFFTALYWESNISLTQVQTQPLHNKHKEQNLNFEGQAIGTWLQDLIPVYWSVLLWHYQILYHNLTDHISSSEVFISQAEAININITL